MAPKPPFNKKATPNTNAPKNQAAEQVAPTTTNYEEVQSDEIEALQVRLLEAISYSTAKSC